MLTYNKLIIFDRFNLLFRMGYRAGGLFCFVSRRCSIDYFSAETWRADMRLPFGNLMGMGCRCSDSDEILN
jgi:hypothetical protein